MLTPFAGAGSKCVAARAAGRLYIGIEAEEEYCKIAQEGLEHTTENADAYGQLSLDMLSGESL